MIPSVFSEAQSGPECPEFLMQQWLTPLSSCKLGTQEEGNVFLILRIPVLPGSIRVREEVTGFIKYLQAMEFGNQEDFVLSSAF